MEAQSVAAARAGARGCARLRENERRHHWWVSPRLRRAAVHAAVSGGACSTLADKKNRRKYRNVLREKEQLKSSCSQKKSLNKIHGTKKYHTDKKKLRLQNHRVQFANQHYGNSELMADQNGKQLFWHPPFHFGFSKTRQRRNKN
jgi:hypothetical protein